MDVYNANTSILKIYYTPLLTLYVLISANDIAFKSCMRS